MPFTLAHPAAAIPLRRCLGRAGVLPALIIGSMTPDLGYFVPFGVSRAFTHSLAGLLWFCLPVGFLTYHLFNILVRPVVYFLAPPCWRDRLPPLPNQSSRSDSPAWAVLISIGLGAFTHLFWDAWTHGNGFFVVRLPILQAHLGNIGGYQVYLYRVLQHGSTLLGFLCMAHWARKYRKSATVRRETTYSPWAERLRVPVLLGLFGVSAVIGMASGLAHGERGSGIHALQLFLGYGVVRAMSICGAGLILLGALLRIGENRWLATRETSTRIPP